MFSKTTFRMWEILFSYKDNVFKIFTNSRKYINLFTFSTSRFIPKFVYWFTNFEPKNIIQDILIEGDSSLLFKKIYKWKFWKIRYTNTNIWFNRGVEIPTTLSFRFSQCYYYIRLKRNDNEWSSIRALFERSPPNKISIFLMSQEKYELRKRTIGANGNV